MTVVSHNKRLTNPHTPRKKKKNTQTHTDTHTHAPKALAAQSTRTRTKNKRESNNKWEIKTEENYLLYAQTEKEDCSSVSVSVYCSHNAQSEKQTGRKREQTEPVAFVGCWCPRRKGSCCCCPRKRQESAQARQPASQPASVLLLLGERERDKAENSRTREHAEQTTNNKHWQQHHENPMIWKFWSFDFDSDYCSQWPWTCWRSVSVHFPEFNAFVRLLAEWATILLDS